MSGEPNWLINALLDKPSSESMGMHGLLISNPGRDCYEIAGINSPRFESQSFREHELYRLIGTGAMRASFVLDLDGVEAPDYMSDIPHIRWAGLYVGTAFKNKAALYELDVEPLISDVTTINIPEGTVELGATDSIFYHIDTWLVRALKQVKKSPDQEIAALMTKCDSTDIKSQTARWLVAPDEITRNRDLDWILRLSRNNGWGIAFDREALVKLYQKTLAAL